MNGKLNHLPPEQVKKLFHEAGRLQSAVEAIVDKPETDRNTLVAHAREVKSKLYELFEQLLKSTESQLERVIRHDLAGIWTVVEGNLQLIEIEKKSSARLGYITQTRRSVYRLIQVLQMFRGESVERISMSAFTQKLSTSLSHEEVVQITSDCTLNVRVNADALFSLLDNIVRNAVLHGHATKIDITICDAQLGPIQDHFVSEKDATAKRNALRYAIPGVVITIADNGLGIDVTQLPEGKQSLEAIFEAGVSSMRDRDQFGIGLAGAPERMAAVGGTICVSAHGGLPTSIKRREYPDQRGAQFTLILPA